MVHPPAQPDEETQQQTDTCNSRQTVIKQHYTNNVIRSTTAPWSIHQPSQMKKLSSRLTPVTEDKQSLNSSTQIMLSDQLQHHIRTLTVLCSQCHNRKLSCRNILKCICCCPIILIIKHVFDETARLVDPSHFTDFAILCQLEIARIGQVGVAD